MGLYSAACALVSLVLTVFLVSRATAVPLAEFFPYGQPQGDTNLAPNDDDSSLLITLSVPFVFFDVGRRDVYVNNNGAITFTNIVSQFTPEAFPLSGPLQIIAPYWADVDTTNTGNLWYRTSTTASLLQKAAEMIHNAFVKNDDFQPTLLLIATWDHVGYYRDDDSPDTGRTNTFQCILATDGEDSFVLYLYADDLIQWTTGDASGGSRGLGGTPAEVGFNAGDGQTSVSVPDSRTSDIINIDMTSNVNRPGVWIYKVSEPSIVTGGCLPRGGVAITMSPRYGNELGGDVISVQGPCFEPNDDIVCRFDDIQVPGVFINPLLGQCVSPMLGRTGRVKFEVFLNGDSKGIAEYTSLAVERAYRVDVQDSTANDVILQQNEVIQVSWSPESILPGIEPGDYYVDIMLFELDTADNVDTAVWNPIATLRQRTENTGRYDIMLSSDITSTGGISPVAVLVAADSLTSEANGDALFNMISQEGILVGQWSSQYYYVEDSALRQSGRLACEEWFNSEASTFADILLESVDPCPRTMDQARLPNSNVRLVNLTSFFGSSEYSGQSMRYFYPNAVSCYRGPTSQSQGSRQECCYDNQRSLLPGGGTVDKVSSEISRVRHFLEDVRPFIFCCKGDFSDCAKYYQRRPSDDGSRFNARPPGWMLGDPHFVTLDGLAFRFNGRGEFSLIETTDRSFTLQGRLVTAGDASGSSVNATVLSAIVARASNSDTVMITRSRHVIDAYINGVRLDFEDIVEERLNNVTIAVSPGDRSVISLSFTSGVFIEVRAENGFVSRLGVSLAPRFRGITRGLLGLYNGDIGDDLLPRDENNALSRHSSFDDIHWNFGVTWIIEEESDSLFTYLPYQNFSQFYSPDFEPSFTPEFTHPQLEAICGQDDACRFDLEVTSRTDIAMATLASSGVVATAESLSLPVVCNPRCENGGVCFANNSCRCPTGFSGARCTIDDLVIEECLENPCEFGERCGVRGSSHLCSDCASPTHPVCSSLSADYSLCADNPCLNRGVCSIHETFATFQCECLPNFSGSTCETEITACTVNPCQNGGTCSEDSITGEAVCDCTSRYTGDECSDLNAVPIVIGVCVSVGVLILIAIAIGVVSCISVFWRDIRKTDERDTCEKCNHQHPLPPASSEPKTLDTPTPEQHKTDLEMDPKEQINVFEVSKTHAHAQDGNRYIVQKTTSNHPALPPPPPPPLHPSSPPPIYSNVGPPTVNFQTSTMV